MASTPPPRQPFTKGPIDFATQLQKLKDRGLIVPDEPRALRYLANISYYRLSGYWDPYLDAAGQQFRPGTTFDDIVRRYRFDKKLRLLCLEGIERLEIAFRTQIIYHFTHDTGDNNWYKQAHFFKQTNTRERGDTQRLLGTILGNPGRQIPGELGRAKEKAFIADYYAKHNHPVNPPAWMTLEVLSFGTLYKLFELFADKRSKIKVAKHFRLNLQVFESWMQSINTIRNKCAHHDRFWDLSLRPISTNQNDPTGQWLQQPGAAASTTKIYYALSVLNFLLIQISPKSDLCAKVLALMQEHGIIADGTHTQQMGFAADWEDEWMWSHV